MEIITYSWIGRFNYCSDVNSPKADLQIQCNPTQNPEGLFLEVDKPNSIYIEMYMTQNGQTIFQEEQQSWGLIRPDFKTVWGQHKGTHIDQWSITESRRPTHTESTDL